MISNACPRCGSTNVEVQANQIFGCKECGKAEKAYLLKLRFELPDEEGKVEPVTLRHYAREYAGLLSDQIGPHMALAIAKLVEAYDVKLPPPVAKQLLTQVLGMSFERLFQLMMPYFPPEMQLEKNKVDGLIIQANALMEMIKSGAAKAKPKEDKNVQPGSIPTGSLAPAGESPTNDDLGAPVENRAEAGEHPPDAVGAGEGGAGEGGAPAGDVGQGA